MAIAAIAAASVVVVVAGAEAGGGPYVTHGSGDLTGLTLNCPTDTVALTGGYQYTENGFVKQVGNDTWFSHGTLSFHLDGVTGLGTSGVSYRLVGATSVAYSFFFGSASPGTDVEHSTQAWLLVPSDGGTPLSFRENFVFVVTPSGATTLVDRGPSDCG